MASSVRALQATEADFSEVQRTSRAAVSVLIFLQADPAITIVVLPEVAAAVHSVVVHLLPAEVAQEAQEHDHGEIKVVGC